MRLPATVLCLAFISCLLVLAVPAVPAQAMAGTIRVFPTSGPAGTRVTLVGWGFTPDSWYTARFGSDDVARGTVDSTGGLSMAQFSVPQFPRGGDVITVVTSAFDTSNAVNFDITPSKELYAPLLLGPKSGASGVSLTPGFNWAPVNGAAGYRFVLASDAALTNTLAGTPVTVVTPSFQVAKPLEANTAYFWSVQVISPDASEGPPSIGTFYTRPNQGPLAPAPTIVVPPVTVERPAITVLPAPAATYVLPPQQPAPAPVTPASVWAIILVGAIFMTAMAILAVSPWSIRGSVRKSPATGAKPVGVSDGEQLLQTPKGGAGEPGGQRPAEALAQPSVAARALADFEALAALGEEVNTVLAHLSPGESYILKCIAEGKSPAWVASSLDVDEDVIRRELSLVADKLASNERARAVIDAARTSLPLMFPKAPQAASPPADYVTKEDLAQFRESLLQSLKSR